MSTNAVERYKEVRLNTSSPGELLLALYDGLFRFLNSSKLCFERDQAAKGREFLGKAHAIVSELYLALDHSVSPELCGNLAMVYDFSLSCITDANRSGNTAKIDDVIRVLTPLREAWQQAVPLAAKEASEKASK